MPIREPSIESMNRRDLQDLQMERLQMVINQAYAHVDFYRRQFDQAGVSPDDIKTIADIKKIPFTTRQDLMDSYPYGLFAVPLRDVVYLQFPSGLYGNPIVIGYTREDLKNWREMVARIMVGVGITEHDVLQVAFNYGLFSGAMRFNQSAELIGAAVVPTSINSAEIQLRIMQDFRSTVLATTPSFALHMAETMKRKKISHANLCLRLALLGAEPWPEEVRQTIEEDLGLQAYDIYGVLELVEPGVAGECPARRGLHINEDHFFAEVIDPVSGDNLPEGEEGELVLTTLTNAAYPLLRYRTNDVTALNYAPCSCGRTFVRMARVLKRTDQMITVRGINVFPEKISEVLTNFPELERDYSLQVRRKKGLNDQLQLNVILSSGLTHGPEKRKKDQQEEIQMALRRAIGLSIEVKLMERMK